MKTFLIRNRSNSFLVFIPSLKSIVYRKDLKEETKEMVGLDFVIVEEYNTPDKESLYLDQFKQELFMFDEIDNEYRWTNYDNHCVISDDLNDTYKVIACGDTLPFNLKKINVEELEYGLLANNINVSLEDMEDDYVKILRI